MLKAFQGAIANFAHEPNGGLLRVPKVAVSVHPQLIIARISKEGREDDNSVTAESTYRRIRLDVVLCNLTPAPTPPCCFPIRGDPFA